MSDLNALVAKIRAHGQIAYKRQFSMPFQMNLKPYVVFEADKFQDILRSVLADFVAENSEEAEEANEEPESVSEEAIETLHTTFKVSKKELRARLKPVPQTLPFEEQLTQYIKQLANP